MAKYLLLKHYRGAPTAPNEASMNPQEFDAHVRYMEEFADRLKESGEYVDSQALTPEGTFVRSEEHTSELQSRGHLVCRLLLEKKKQRDDALCQIIGVYSRMSRSSR